MSIFVLACFWHLGYLNFYSNNILSRAYGIVKILDQNNSIKPVLEINFNNQSKILNFNLNLAIGRSNVFLNNLGGPKNDKNFQEETLSDLEKNSLSFSTTNFILPVLGINWGKLHPKNAVDIASGCGSDVFASADGLVIDLKDGGWNNGYGKYIKIEHFNQIQTVYAHLNKLNVSLGDYVRRGQKIGEVGNTGEATGCHLHFEVLGAKNPFIK